MKRLLGHLFCFTLLAAPLHVSESPDNQAVLDHITADSLRGNLSFLASDALEGRDTPSRGLDIAAEFIASQFRRAGLEAPGDSYFQVADYYELTRGANGGSFTIDHKGESIAIEPGDLNIRSNSPIDLESVPVYKMSGDTLPDDIAGKAVIVPARSRTLRALREKNPALIISTVGRARSAPPRRELVAVDQVDTASAPVVAVRGERARAFLDALPDGPTDATLSVHAPPPRRQPVKLRNVVGILRGSDPDLKDTCIIVSAHYDHLGMNPPSTDPAHAGDDRIFNGANDDGSGVVSVIELAGALATMHPHPRRTILFMTVFGEERGLLGSQYYVRHPIFPLDKTIADVNIEQVGRTDDSETPQIASATITGFTYSDLPQLFAEAGKATGVKVYDRNPSDDPYFARSDNQPFADAGIPSHTAVVALEFPDYHAVGDEWHKIDYNNMTVVDRMLGLGVISLANDRDTPRWNKSNQNTRKYVTAWEKLQPKPLN